MIVTIYKDGKAEDFDADSVKCVRTDGDAPAIIEVYKVKISSPPAMELVFGNDTGGGLLRFSVNAAGVYTIG